MSEPCNCDWPDQCQGPLGCKAVTENLRLRAENAKLRALLDRWLFAYQHDSPLVKDTRRALEQGAQSVNEPMKYAATRASL
jgi:hypothetical protein